MNEIDKLKKQKEKLEEELEEKKQKEKLEEEVKALQRELQGKAQKENFSNSIAKGFEAFQRFADRHGVDDTDDFFDEKKKRKK